ncbi:amino acid transporter [Penicillium cataractarum]|uniref:Amino acid transporter n=1 Tax=Penicillium cataractarum TaxID=2100454 RepID=A0A9W9SGI5_9EURO|nr:amino acid transporter [Penicillium cataractarum]KAJ5378201.1 amino acid transporter [Penicillium cataractarum]
MLDEKAPPHPALDTVETRREGQMCEVTQLNNNRFNLWSTIGIQFSVTAAPLGIAGYTTLITGVGGSPFYFWGFLVAVIGQLLVALSLAELSSAYPHTSGQIYWTAILSPPQYARFLSYLNGAMTTFGWIFASAGTAVFAADFIASFGQLVSDTYEPTSWQIFLLVITVLIVAFILNTLLITLFICIALLATVHPKASAKSAFMDVVNETGWSSDGLQPTWQKSFPNHRGRCQL